MDSRPVLTSLDEDIGPAPCDFDRTYRGTIGETHLTVLIRPDAGGKLAGLVHYDKPGPAIVISGARRGEEGFTLEERGAGRFEGRCDAIGTLSGSYTLGKRKLAFALKPRPAEWPGLYQVTQSIEAEPHHPLCAKHAQPNAAVELEDGGRRIICLPTNPKVKKDLVASARSLLCSATDHGYRVFGLPDRAVEKRVNEVLSPSWLEYERKEIEHCTSPQSVDFHAGLLVARRDLLVLSSFRSRDYGGAHPMNVGGGSTAIDLVQGSSVALDEVIDPAKLRDLTIACLPFYGASQASNGELVLDKPLPQASCEDEMVPGARILWGCHKDDRTDPESTLLPEGIVIGMWANPHVSASDDGKGPILPWSVLMREKMLRPGSKVARLWAGITPAPADAPACPMALVSGPSIVTWREVPQP